MPAEQALAGLRNIRNHLEVDPKAKITVVTHAQGVDFLMVGAKDKNGGDYAGPVSALKAQGVNFEICEITLKQPQPEEGRSSSWRPTSRRRASCASPSCRSRARPTSSHDHRGRQSAAGLASGPWPRRHSAKDTG